MAFNPNQPRDSHGRFGEVAAHAASAIANVVSSTGNAATVARAISSVLKNVPKSTKLDLSKFKSYAGKMHVAGSTGGFSTVGWLRDKSKQWLGGNLLHSGEREDVVRYSDESRVNQFLRGYVDIEDETHHLGKPAVMGGLSAVEHAMIDHQSHVMGLEGAIAKSITNEHVVLYRGLGTTRGRFGVEGNITEDPGFVSTSFDAGKAANFSKNGRLAHIYVKKGMRALVLDGYSEHPHEAEVLLPRNSRFRTLHYTGDDQHVHLELLPPEGGYD